MEKKNVKRWSWGTLMSNYGLEKLFQEKIKFIRTKVGDRYVKEAMKNNKCNLGGEQSGHITWKFCYNRRWDTCCIRGFIFYE